jgi:hypothetical protein
MTLAKKFKPEGIEMFHESDGDTSSEDEGDERLEEPNLQPVAL